MAISIANQIAAFAIVYTNKFLLNSFSKNVLVYYCKYCNLIGYATRYLFVNRYRVAASNATRPRFSQKNNAHISFFEIILKK